MNVEILARPLCFGNFGFEKPGCGSCPFRRKCMDDQAGWAVSYVLEQLFQLEIVEELAGENGVKVSALLRKIDQVPEEDISWVFAKHPEAQKIYQLWSAGSIKTG